jgi:hypothetical protein
MRPLKPIAQLADLGRAAQDRSVLEAMLIDARGSWCSICERPVLEQAWAWDIASQVTVPETESVVDVQSDWLLLCRNCQDAQACMAPRGGDDLSLPPSDDTFALDGTGVFHYELVQREIPYIGHRREEIRWEVRPLVMIKSDDPRGQATIKRFALNGNRPDGEIVVDPERRDRRLELRTAAWESARRLAQSLERPDGVAAAQTLRTVTNAGFLSVWLSVFRSERSREWVSEWAFGLTVDGGMRGTDWTRLLGRPEES